MAARSRNCLILLGVLLVSGSSIKGSPLSYAQQWKAPEDPGAEIRLIENGTYGFKALFNEFKRLDRVFALLLLFSCSKQPYLIRY
jgi:hypothetical protein